jgi:hypothetical protein
MQGRGKGGMGCVMIGEQWGVGQIWEDGSRGWCVVLSRDLCNMFRIIKRKNMFMKTNMTGDIHVMRFNVKTSITKMRGTVAKIHTWRRPKIQFMIIIGTQKGKQRHLKVRKK